MHGLRWKQICARRSAARASEPYLSLTHADRSTYLVWPRLARHVCLLALPADATRTPLHARCCVTYVYICRDVHVAPYLIFYAPTYITQQLAAVDL